MSDSINNLLRKELVLLKPSGSSIPLQFLAFDLIEQDTTLCECRLTFRVTSQLYQQIETESLFNLKPELRGAFNVASFHSDVDIEIEATLQPQLLPQLAEHATDKESAIAYLTTCSSPNPLLSTESWFALKVSQNLESGEIGYRTFWSYLNPASLTPDAIANGQFPQAMEQFLKDRNEANLLMAEQAISKVLEEISHDLKNWDETEFLKQTETAISDFFSEVTNALESWVEPNQAIGKTKAKGKIYQAMLDFFSQEDWEFTKLKGELTLRLACQGKNGQWNCYALANEEQQQFLFYSICPLEVPSLNRSAIAEFLTRANYGMVIGNFEFNFDTGEIRCKTSIDVTGDRITSSLIERLVYANVITLDQYLPGILAVIAGKLSPTDAIALVETNTDRESEKGDR
ncbi:MULTISPECIES: YbjN domain-containing protein [unclassified Tolypothrix]|uniref:YbjN domain-containing protein n=1 Tax=unclassified Tolypothrix TaxID=2649714 RepID=UPI0005EAC36C|nr:MULTISPECIES: YbjN domain-containing protein [unclassified Tolypothrix]BAY90666.1 hypothetical protein NIES3275_26830 [Microchaete diplosiphon NIES-3275]EKF01519.1 hypothetical protein FDUTEX481_07861 [Tolypothrix sp. PCC 7601]MBE9082622.1 YbjN domain-containing protein [Tolypothrix sp. LEGE 11397]UYD24816.1 YbjN domain-containing protein [Tolypothrix sp. PCC 7712]UYD32953.1 YbjN domain-containing protein [Tolypothrix sp. PCC 7601]